MNYEKMSDFEINRKVLAIVSSSKPLSYAHDADKRSAGIVKSSQYYWYDYCNSWADAGPIIESNAIGLGVSRPGDSRHWIAYCWKDNYCGEVRVRDSNPLRAAMIVFLMMQEDK